MHGIDVVFLMEGSVEPKNLIMCEFYIALTSLAGEYFPGEQMRSMIHVIDLVF